MATYGLTASGFVPKPQEAIIADINGKLQKGIADSIPLDETSVWGNIVAPISAALAELWDLGEAVYHAGDPDGAEGDPLVTVCAVTGTVPLTPLPSKATLTCVGTPGTVLASGRVVSVQGISASRFDTIVSATITALTAWVATTAYSLGDRRANGGNAYVCTVAGTSAGSGGPTGTGTGIVDGTVTWKYLGAGTGAVDVAAQCETTGPTIALAGTLTVIETSVSGWNTVTNLADATPGTALETDTALRMRREAELPGESASTVDAMRVRISEDVSGVTSCVVFANDTESTNADGLPAHSVEVLVQGGVDQDIGNAVFANKPASAGTYGNQVPVTVVDNDNGGQTYRVYFSRPVPRNVYVVMNVTKDPNTFPADGATQIRDALLSYGTSVLKPGRDVVAAALNAQGFKVTGVLDSQTFIGLAPSPASSTTLVMALRDLALLDSSRITINLTNGTP